MFVAFSGQQSAFSKTGGEDPLPNNVSELDESRHCEPKGRSNLCLKKRLLRR
jgi:hypothetical protein